MLTDPPRPEHLEIVTRYAPAGDAARIGGDWYDAFLQQSRGPGGHDVVVVVGDVVGHDVEAAAAIEHNRGLLRGLAVHSGYAPAAVLSGVDTVMQSLQMETTATAVVARFERHPRAGADAGEEVVLRWAHAGHPPALLLTPGGDVTRLADVDDNDLLLGLDPATRRAEQVAFVEPGATLILYTDGLVERRGRDVDEGIEALIELRTRHGARRGRRGRPLRPAARRHGRRHARGRRGPAGRAAPAAVTRAPQAQVL